MTAPRPAFARDSATAEYYDRRAAEYDEWYLSEGQFATRERPGWSAEVDRLVELVRGLPAGRTLDVACGSGFLTRHLRGFAVGLDQSPAMVALAQSRLPDGLAIVGDALDLPFADNSFDRILTGHFYGHLPPDERDAFLAEARRVAGELVVVDAALRDNLDPEQWQERILNDGSRHQVYKRYLRAQQLADEIAGQVLLDGSWFVVARTSWGPRGLTPEPSHGARRLSHPITSGLGGPHVSEEDRGLDAEDRGEQDVHPQTPTAVTQQEPSAPPSQSGGRPEEPLGTTGGRGGRSFGQVARHHPCRSSPVGAGRTLLPTPLPS